jgi:hypothetical protein
LLYLRRQDVPKIAKRHGWLFQTKLEVGGRPGAFGGRNPALRGKTGRVVIVQEETDPRFFYCTDPHASVQEISRRSPTGRRSTKSSTTPRRFGEAASSRCAISGPTSAEPLDAYAGGLWAWHKTAKQLTRRDDSPWDTAERRPSHADRRKALQAACLKEDFLHRVSPRPYPRKFRMLLKRLPRLAI